MKIIQKEKININSHKCTGCGFCVNVCPDNVFTLSAGKVIIAGEKCIECGHCMAVCPEQAITYDLLTHILEFKTFTEKTDWIPYGKSNISDLVQLLRSRRSCRNYIAKPVSRDLLEDLVKIGTTAPSGTNSQAWTFTILQSRKEVISFGGKVSAFYRDLNRKAENPVLRLLAKYFLGDSLGKYYRTYYESIALGLREWDEEGKDRLFHGATSIILIGSTTEASCPAEDAMLATQNILIAAHAMGLGTCLIGFAVEAIKRDKNLTRYLSLP
ncbi:MAG: nitroreductase family protein, partial [Desulfobulbaceae bacterium]|nr:nitroreductase family protein [Desulfobulbaceae bacterium]